MNWVIITSANGLLPYDTKAIPKPMLTYWKTQQHSNQNKMIFIKAEYVVCKMPAILLKPQLLLAQMN